MSLDVDGILHVTAIEKDTGKSKHVTIQDAFAVKSPEQIAAARRRLEELYAPREEEFELNETEFEEMKEPAAAAALPGREDAEKLLARSRGLLGTMHAEDVEEAVGLHERIATAMAAGDAVELKAATDALRELLFFLEGK